MAVLFWRKRALAGLDGAARRGTDVSVCSLVAIADAEL